MKIKVLLAAVALMCVSCSKFDNSEINNRLSELDGRVSALENIVNLLNGDVTTIQNLFTATAKGIYIAQVSETTTGYRFLLSDGSIVEVRHGAAGGDGKSPVVGIKEDTDGVCYWTLDGQWLTDASGNKVSAEAVTPQFRMSGVFLQVSYDAGKTWSNLCEISGGSTTPAIKQVTVEDDFVIFTLADDSTVSLPRVGSTMSIEIVEGEELGFTDGQKIAVNYEVKNAPDAVKVSVIAGGNWDAKAVPATATTGTIEITAPTPVSEAEVLIFAYSNSLVAMTSILCKEAGSPGPGPSDGHVVKAVIGGTATTLAAVEGTSSYTATVSVPAKTEFVITIDDVEYGFVTRSGNGGLGNVTSTAVMLPVSLLPTSAHGYNVTKSVGLMGKISDSANKFWTDLSASAQAKLTVTITDEKTSYRFDLVKNDASVLYEEDFSLFSLGSDYMAPCFGYVIPSDFSILNYDGLTPPAATEMTADVANGAEAFDYPTKVKLSVATDEFAANRDLTGWEVNYMAEHPCCASLGAYKGASFARTPGFAGSYSGDAVVEFSLSRFSDSDGPVYVSVIGGGKFVSGTSTIDGRTGSQTWSSFTDSDTKIVLAKDDNWFPNPGKTDAGKPISHFSFVVTGVGPETRIMFDAPIPSKVAPRFYIHDFKASKK